MKRLMNIAENLTVLYVEDELEVRNEVGSFLSLVFKEVYMEEDGESGIISFINNTPDLIMTDIRMPKLNGIEMTRELRKTNPDVPIVVLSAFNDNNILLDSVDLGISKYVLKPFKKETMIRTLTSVVESINSKKEKELEQKQLKVKHRYLTKALEAVNIGFWEWNINTQKAHYNQKSLEILEQDFASCALSFTISQIMGHLDEDSRNNMKAALNDATNEHKKIDLSVKFTGKDSNDKYLRFVTIEEKKKKGVLLGMVADTTKDIQEKDKLAKMATKDQLTGLINKSMYRVFLNKQFEIAKRYDQKLSILKITINDFAHINNTIGNRKADKLIVEFVNMVNNNLRKSDIFARIFGVEFAVILPKCSQDSAKMLANKIMNAVRNGDFSVYEEPLSSSYAIVSNESDLPLVKINNNLENLFKKAKENPGTVITEEQIKSNTP